MKKFLLIFFASLLRILGYAQKIKVDELDKFTNSRVVETSFEKIVSDKNLMGSTGGRLMKNIWVAFRHQDGTDYLRLKWCTNNVLALSDDADIILLDADGNTYTFKNCGFTVAGKGEGTVGAFGSALYGLNIYLTGDVSALEGKVITDMRINTTDGYIDFELGKKNGEKIAKTYAVFKAALEK